MAIFIPVVCWYKQDGYLSLIARGEEAGAATDGFGEKEKEIGRRDKKQGRRYAVRFSSLCFSR